MGFSPDYPHRTRTRKRSFSKFRKPYARRWRSFIFLWKPSVIPLFFEKRNIQAISSFHESSVRSSVLMGVEGRRERSSMQVSRRAHVPGIIPYSVGVSAEVRIASGRIRTRPAGRDSGRRPPAISVPENQILFFRHKKHFSDCKRGFEQLRSIESAFYV